MLETQAANDNDSLGLFLVRVDSSHGCVVVTIEADSANAARFLIKKIQKRLLKNVELQCGANLRFRDPWYVCGRGRILSFSPNSPIGWRGDLAASALLATQGVVDEFEGILDDQTAPRRVEKS